MPVPTQLEVYAQLLEQSISQLRALEKLCTEVRSTADQSLDTILRGIVSLEAQQERVKDGKFPEMGKLIEVLIGGGAGLSLLGQQLLQMQGISVPIPLLSNMATSSSTTEEPPSTTDLPLTGKRVIKDKSDRLTFSGVGLSLKIIHHVCLGPNPLNSIWQALEQPNVYGGKLDTPSIIRFFNPSVRDLVSPRVDWYSNNSQTRRQLRRTVNRIQRGYLSLKDTENSSSGYRGLMNKLRSKYFAWEDLFLRLVEVGLLSLEETGTIIEEDPSQSLPDGKYITLLGDTHSILQASLLKSPPEKILHVLPIIYGQNWQHYHIWIHPVGKGSAGHRRLGEDVRLKHPQSALWAQLRDAAQKIETVFQDESLLVNCSPLLRSLIDELTTKYKSWYELSFVFKDLGIID